MDMCLEKEIAAEPSPRERAWSVMIGLKTFTVADVAEAAGVPKQKVSTFVQFLLDKQRLTTVRAERPYKFAVTNPEPLVFGKGQREGGGIKVHRKSNKARQRMWNAMRVLRKFCVLDIMMAAEVGRTTAHGYLIRLCRAGYLRVLRSGGNQLGERATYLLIRNSGPKSPVDRGRQGMWDVNEQELFLFKDGSNE